MIEYKSIDLPLNEDPAAVLNEHGKEGWECCGMVRVPRNEVAVGGEFLRVIFKRDSRWKTWVFATIVQTEAIVNDLRRERSLAGQLVDEAFRVDVDSLPADDVNRCALQYVNYGYGGIRPEWLKSVD